ncbi:MAG: YkoF family thiamine/hydroxymethylpyrimidine-binding protein [Halioglobus sp.]
MKLTAELSLYPLDNAYIPIIKSFIDKAADQNTVKVISNAMSTQLCGEWDDVMALVSQGLRQSYEEHGKQVLVCKLIPGELPIQ